MTTTKNQPPAQPGISSHLFNSTCVVVAAVNLGATPSGWSLPTPSAGRNRLAADGSTGADRRPCLVSRQRPLALPNEVSCVAGCHDRAVCCAARRVAAKSIRQAPIAIRAGCPLPFLAAEAARYLLWPDGCHDLISRNPDSHPDSDPNSNPNLILWRGWPGAAVGRPARWPAFVAASRVWTSSRCICCGGPTRRCAARSGGVVSMALSGGLCRARAGSARPIKVVPS